jgi:hypothetical protein
VKPRDAVAFASLAAAALLVGVPNLLSAYDDAFITYRYAWHFAAGDGLVYNVGERFYGTTAAGYALVLGLLSKGSPDRVPLVSGVFNITALVLVGTGLYAFGRLRSERLVGFVAAAFVVVNPIVIDTFSGEMLPQAALIVWAMVAQAAGTQSGGGRSSGIGGSGGRSLGLLAMLLASLATVVRPDGILAVWILLAWQWAASRRVPWREGLFAGVLIAAWLAWCLSYYGTPLPRTLGAKHAQVASGIFPPFVGTTIEWIRAYTGAGSPLFGRKGVPLFEVFLVAAAVGVPALVRHRAWTPLVAWAAVFCIGYWWLNVPFYHWYAVPPMVGLAVLAGVGVAWLAQSVTTLGRGGALASKSRSSPIEPRAASPEPRAATDRWGRALPDSGGGRALALLVILLLAPVWIFMGARSIALARMHPDRFEQRYINVGRWLRDHTQPGSSVGYLEIGIVGYYSQRPIVDVMGLVNAGVAPNIARGDFLWAYRHYRPDYIVHNPVFFPGVLGIVVDQPWFTQEYRQVAELAESGLPTLVIYRRTPFPRAGGGLG